MKSEKILLILFSGLLFVSCQPRYTRNKTILRAESLLNTNPDSAYLLLSSMPHPEKLSEPDYAAWCLHLTHAQYKLYMDTISDSLIRVAVDYYSKTKLYKYSGTAYYLLGCIEQIHKKNADAMAHYKAAEEELSGTEENNLKGLVDFKIGYIYMQDDLYFQSLNYYKKSNSFFQKTNNNKNLVYVFREISSMYDKLDYPKDSVLLYVDLALKLSELVGDSINYYNILSQKGMILYNIDYNLSKKELLKAYQFMPKQRSYYSAYLSFIYSKLNRIDSASYYLKIALSDTVDINADILKFIAGAYVEKDAGNLNQAFGYLEKAYNLRDTVFNQNIHSQLYRIDKQYDLTEKEKENAALIIANRTKVIWITLLIIGVLVVLLLLLIINTRYRKRQNEHKIEKQRLEFEIRKKELENEQKRKILLEKLQNKIENTLRFNKLKQGYLQKDKQDAFIDEITRQSVISENEIQFYIDEVDSLYNGKLKGLSVHYSQITQADLIVIALICLEVDIPNSCIFLNMTQNTLYVRRKRIKKRLEIDAEAELEEWIKQNIF